MGYVVPFMNGKGGTGKSVLARAYAVEAARAGASVLIADLDDVRGPRSAGPITARRTVSNRNPRGAGDAAPCLRHGGSNGRTCHRYAGLDRPPDAEIARWSTFCVIPSRANRMDDLSETVRLLYALKKDGIEDWRFGVALNALRSASAKQDDADARAYLQEVGFKALPGHVRDLRAYEIALLEGKAITETAQKALNDEAFVLVNGIAGAVLEAGRHLTRQAANEPEPEKTRGKGRDKGGRGR